ncbi:MAG: AraC family transcriptional regulator [Oscillospiraceae bacterium]|nr:AraC family transcriptional regulator [Oscillospiraceae bacterium]
MRIHHIYNKWLIRHNSEQVGEIADYEAMAEAYPNVYAMLDEIQASYAAWAAAPVSRPVAGALSNETFKNIYQYLVNHYNQNISLTYLADLFHVNPCYISQMFRKNLDCTLVEFLNQQRIDQAALLLRTSGSKIAQIAEDVGFNDYFYFSRVFRKIMHCSPSEYRSRTTGPKPS